MDAAPDDAELAEADLATPAGENHEADTPTIAQMTMIDAGERGTGFEHQRDQHRGSASTTSAMATLATFTGLSAATAGCSLAISSASFQPPSESYAREAPRRWTSRASRMMTRVTTLSSDGVSVFQRTVCSMTPITMAAPKATGIDSIRATMAAASAGSSRAGPERHRRCDAQTGCPQHEGQRTPTARRVAHTRVVSRRTGIPRRRARSVFSAAARIP